MADNEQDMRPKMPPTLSEWYAMPEPDRTLARDRFMEEQEAEVLRGFEALSRPGVTFTDEQKAAIQHNQPPAPAEE